MSHYASDIPKTFVLCFDGTGNKFSGDESDSNIEIKDNNSTIISLELGLM
ncbi:conserved hypothetical protein [Histoplasma capsulatum H143]|uniref:Uncharacterized protein n=1 Tax=Ajellomyces capsulatus (strain H143) TaxID=544712 RepID=C6HMY3_AJECH|nr:conserved hypothetical protein [Histoplasma capsulatum H143]